jgi:biotin carboxylase
VDSFSGRGVSVVNSDSAKQLSSAILNAKKASRTGEIIVEEFVQGQLYSVSAFVVDRKVVREFFVAEFCTVNPFVVDLSYLATDLPHEIVEKIRLHLERMSNALDLADGLLHVQFIYDGQNFSFIETTRRCPGDLYSQLIELATGFEYSKAYAAAFVDLRHEQSNEKQEFILRHTVSRSYHVRLDSLTIKEPVNLRRLIPLSLVGDQLAPSPTSRVAILFMSTKTENSLTELATKISNNELLDLN